jgi:hypothetical protein
MIRCGFWISPPGLWKTLWAKAAAGQKTLVLSCFSTACTVWQQSTHVNEINNLAVPIVFIMTRCNRADAFRDRIKSWG